MTATTAESSDLAYLWARLGAVEWRVRRAVAARMADDPAPDDPHRGLYLTAEAVRRVLDGRPEPLPPPDADPDLDVLAAMVPGPGPRLLTLARRFALEPVDVEFLLVAVAPDVDARFERLYGYLNDDVTRRRATVGLALELCGLPAAGGGRFRFASSAPLVAAGLVEVRDNGLPALSRPLRVPDRVVAHLLGDDEPDPAIGVTARLVSAGGAPESPWTERVAAGPESPWAERITTTGLESPPAGMVAARPGPPWAERVTTGSESPAAGPESSWAERITTGPQSPSAGIESPSAERVAAAGVESLAGRIAAGLRAGIRSVHLRDADGDADRLALDALAAAGRDALVLDVPAVAGRTDPPFAEIVREARLRGAGLVFGPLEPLLPERARLIRDLTALVGDVPLVLHSRRHWDPRWTAHPVVSVPVPPPAADWRADRWARALADATGTAADPALVADLAGYRLGTDQVDRAVSVAARLAVLEDRPVGLAHVRAGVRAQNSPCWRSTSPPRRYAT
jgi:hypothetical protein